MMEPATQDPAHTAPWLYVGLFLTSCSVLMLELVTTRVLTVVKGSHLAFMTISLAMFGLSAGAIYVLLRPARVKSAFFAGYSLSYAASILFCFASQLFLRQAFEPTLTGTLSTLALVGVTAVPYFLSGVCVSSILSSMVRRIHWLYAVDLIGASLGIWLMALGLSYVSGETAVMGAALLATLGAAALALYGGHSARLKQSLLLASLLLVGGGWNQVRPWLQIPTHDSGRLEIVRWNPYSRVTAERRQAPPGWGLSDSYRGPAPVHYWLEIDGSSGTPVIGFDGQVEKVAYLGADITAVPFHLRPNSSVAVIGAGGGKDVLTSLLFNNPETYGVELNGLIVDMLKGRLREFSGNLVGRAHFSVADGRTWMAQQNRKFDIIQLAMVDNANAFATGAITLSENGLYTQEAWRSFVAHLSERGVLSVSMGYYQDRPAELYRCLALGAATLRCLGIEPTEKHFLINQRAYHFKVAPAQPDGVFTLLLGRKPFSDQDRANFSILNRELGFNSLLPGPTQELTQLARGQSPPQLAFDVTPPSDSHPFFFFSVRPGDFLKDLQVSSSSVRALIFLGQLLIVSLVMVALCWLVPWWASQRSPNRWASKPDLPLVYFLLLGLGYMLVEVAMTQRLSIFLGNPSWSLCVVLSTMLLSSGLGSASSGRLGRHPNRMLALLLLVLVLSALVLPWLTGAMAAASWANRVIVSGLLLIPAAFLMGIPFPMGLSRMAGSERLAWCWALNGAGSLLAAPLAMITAVFLGIPWVLALGTLAYSLATLLSPKLTGETD